MFSRTLCLLLMQLEHPWLDDQIRMENRQLANTAINVKKQQIVSNASWYDVGETKRSM
jgi:hypothetical protein